MVSEVSEKRGNDAKVGGPPLLSCPSSGCGCPSRRPCRRYDGATLWRRRSTASLPHRSPATGTARSGSCCSRPCLEALDDSGRLQLRTGDTSSPAFATAHHPLGPRPLHPLGFHWSKCKKHEACHCPAPPASSGPCPSRPTPDVVFGPTAPKAP
eukprot:scaffold1342_cov204-Pinguiococcus_pyrenoidosus.AAC.2